MKVWIDQDLCTGDGLCEEIAPDVFTLLDDGLAYVVESGKIFAEAKGNPQGAEGLRDPRRPTRSRDRIRRGMPRRVHLHRALISLER
jgi:ferredoxin